MLPIPPQESSSYRSLATEIAELNLSYLMLAQRLLLDDYETARFHLGIGPEVADSLLALSTNQIFRLAHCGSLVCRARFDDLTLLSSLTRECIGGVLQKVQSVILLAGQGARRAQTGT